MSHELTPPRRLIDIVGGGDFRSIGEEFRGYFLKLGGLQPDDRVLDVGCGVGRMAIPLVNYLSQRGGYWGFDITKEGIEWCRAHVSSKYPNFQFQLADVYNKQYNPHGRFRASEYEFPYDDEFFDFVTLMSVFTHMLPDDLRRYFSEISRVMKPGGRSMMTFFLLNDESMDLINAGQGKLHFVFDMGSGCMSTDADRPERAVAYREEVVRYLYQEYGLEIVEPVHVGSWCGRNAFVSYQDMVISRKTQ